MQEQLAHIRRITYDDQLCKNVVHREGLSQRHQNCFLIGRGYTHERAHKKQHSDRISETYTHTTASKDKNTHCQSRRHLVVHPSGCCGLEHGECVGEEAADEGGLAHVRIPYHNHLEDELPARWGGERARGKVSIRKEQN